VSVCMFDTGLVCGMCVCVGEGRLSDMCVQRNDTHGAAQCLHTYVRVAQINIPPSAQVFMYKYVRICIFLYIYISVCVRETTAM
jgi:hypothetical protein